MSPLKIEEFLKLHLDQLLPNHSTSEVYAYATLPGGKLFRPSLVWSVLQDLNPALYEASSTSKTSAHALLSSSIECHHSYTLIHDDLPCMDNDSIRRGKPATHIRYGEWSALLTGDGLLNISYQLLGKIKNRRALELLQFYSWATGPKGLIHGQVLDLSCEMTKSLENTLRTHELKTARLIQVAILGSALLAINKDSKKEKQLWKFSRLLGINFQLIDDLSELAEMHLSEHEKEVNPWLNYSERTLMATLEGLKKFNELSEQLNLTHTNTIIAEYYRKMIETLSKHQMTIENHLDKNINILPIISVLKVFG